MVKHLGGPPAYLTRLAIVLLLVLWYCVPAHAQFTTVTGTVTDTNGLAYACGTISAQLIVPGGTAPTLNGGGFTTQTSPVQLGCPTIGGSGANGSFTMRLADNNVVSPSGTQWKFTVNANGVPPPIGTGPQTCTATLTITGTSQSVSSSFSACPALSNVSGVGGNAAPSMNAIYSSSKCPQPNVNNCYFVNDDGRYVSDATTTLNSAIVTSPTANFTGTDVFGRPNAKVGQHVWVLNGGTQICPSTASVFTVQSIDSATQIHLSGNCTASVAGTAILAWATDDTTNLNNAFAAAISACLPVVVPARFMKVSAAWFIQALTSTCSGTFPYYSAPVILGSQELTTSFLMGPDFNWTSCTGGRSGHACVIGQAAVAMENVTITALGLTNYTINTPTILVELNDGGHLHLVDLTNIGQGLTNLTCLVDESSQGDLYVGGSFNCGGPATLINPIFGPAHATGWLFQNPGAEVSNSNCNIATAFVCGFVSTNGIFMNNSATPALKVDAGATMWANADVVRPIGFVEVAGTMLADGLTAPNGVQVDSGGKFYTKNARQLGNAGVTAAINCLAGSQTFDQGANTLSFGSGQPNCSGLLTQLASDSGPQQTSGNWSVPAGSGAGQWGTSPSVASCSGGQLFHQCTITVGSGTVGANPVLTVTFPTNLFGTPIGAARMVGGTATLASFTTGTCTWSTSSASCPFTYQGTPAASSTLIVQITASM